MSRVASYYSLRECLAFGGVKVKACDDKKAAILGRPTIKKDRDPEPKAQDDKMIIP
jgi:hypothetical protein